MKKKCIAVLALALTFAGSVQALEYAPGTVLFNAGIGLGTTGGDAEMTTTTTTTAGSIPGTQGSGTQDLDGEASGGGAFSADWFPSLQLAQIGLSFGLEMDFFFAPVKIKSMSMKDDTIAIPVLARVGWHPVFIEAENFDLYLVGKIGWTFATGWHKNAKDLGVDMEGGFTLGIAIGGRYYFSPQWGAFLELGINSINLQSEGQQQQSQGSYYTITTTYTLNARLTHFLTAGITFRFGGGR